MSALNPSSVFTSDNSGIEGCGGSKFGYASAMRLLDTSSSTSSTTLASSSMVAAMLVQACSTIAKYELENKGLSVEGHKEGNI